MIKHWIITAITMLNILFFAKILAKTTREQEIEFIASILFQTQIEMSKGSKSKLVLNVFSLVPKENDVPSGYVLATTDNRFMIGDKSDLHVKFVSLGLKTSHKILGNGEVKFYKHSLYDPEESGEESEEDSEELKKEDEKAKEEEEKGQKDEKENEKGTKVKKNGQKEEEEEEKGQKDEKENEKETKGKKLKKKTEKKVKHKAMVMPTSAIHYFGVVSVGNKMTVMNNDGLCLHVAENGSGLNYRQCPLLNAESDNDLWKIEVKNHQTLLDISKGILKNWSQNIPDPSISSIKELIRKILKSDGVLDFEKLADATKKFNSHDVEIALSELTKEIEEEKETGDNKETKKDPETNIKNIIESLQKLNGLGQKKSKESSDTTKFPGKSKTDLNSSELLKLIENLEKKNGKPNDDQIVQNLEKLIKQKQDKEKLLMEKLEKLINEASNQKEEINYKKLIERLTKIHESKQSKDIETTKEMVIDAVNKAKESFVKAAEKSVKGILKEKNITDMSMEKFNEIIKEFGNLSASKINEIAKEINKSNITISSDKMNEFIDQLLKNDRTKTLDKLAKEINNEKTTETKNRKKKQMRKHKKIHNSLKNKIREHIKNEILEEENQEDHSTTERDSIEKIFKMLKNTEAGLHRLKKKILSTTENAEVESSETTTNDKKTTQEDTNTTLSSEEKAIAKQLETDIGQENKKIHDTSDSLPQKEGLSDLKTLNITYNNNDPKDSGKADTGGGSPIGGLLGEIPAVKAANIASGIIGK